MTQPHRKSDRTRLMLGCGGAALALAMVLAPQRAAAQGIQASPSLVSGSASVTSPVANTTRIDVFSQTAVIDWTPLLDNSGNALSFLPTGSTADFRGIAPNFAVLNRILPTTNNNIAVIDGSVLSQFGNPSSGFATGGFIAFYSPTGILVGPNARFDVGSLMLTTLDTTPTSFTNFANGGFLSLQGQQGSRATITVSPGAQIVATRENSFFTIVAADVEMRGTALVNGSHAYVAGEVVDMRFSNGLFDILVSAGTAASGEVVTLNGTIGGPSSNGAGDNHMIYAVARASQDPISMLLSGNIGFAPAQSAGIINGEIILAANYNVSGRRVAGGSIEDGINAVFFGNNELSATRADIFLDDFTATSSLLAAGTHRTQARAINASASVTGNLLLVGREQASAVAVNGRTFTVTGDVLVNATDYGVLNSSLQSLDVINAQGGQASLNAAGGTIRIGGNVSVTADAFGGADTLNLIAGTARGGQARMGANGGSLAISGTAMVSAGGFGVNLGEIITGAEARGGLAQFFVTQGGSVSVGENLVVMAEAVGATGSINDLSTVSNAFGGEARIIGDLGGSAAITGFVFVGARAIANRTNTPVDGALADAGVAEVFINANNTLTIGGDLLLAADAFGGENAGGRGGQALGGAARAVVQNGGRISVGGISASADARGGAGTSGGDGLGGVAEVLGGLGGVLNATGLNISAQGSGGFAIAGRGGNGIGGTAGFEIDGLSATIDGSVLIDASGSGSNSADGASGDGRGGTAYISSETGQGTLNVSGDTSVFANGLGAESLGAFAAGNGRGGTAYIDVLNGSTMSFNTAQIGAVGRGGESALHEGGDGTGGIVLLRSSGAGSFLSIDRNVSRAIADESPAGDALLNADGIGRATFGGDGIGGAGRGGSVIVSALGGGIIELPPTALSDPASVGVVRVRANGTGGGSAAEGGSGGIGAGGSVGIDVEGQGSSLRISEADFSVLSQGGSSLDASRNITGGAGIGGRRTIRVFNGGTLSLRSFGGQTRALGGDGTGTGNGGIAQGGSNGVEINGGTLNFTGILALLDEATGGFGLRGGDALACGECGGVAFIANDATITTNFGGQSTNFDITLDAIATGGGGASGGNAETSGVVFNLLNTNINSFAPTLFVRSAATGGNATDPAGTGGNAISGPIGVQFTNASLDFVQMLFASDAIGGDGGGVSGTGGNAQSGIVNVQMTGSSVTDSFNQSLIFEARSRATGGGGTIGGNGTSGQSTLALTNSVITGGRIVDVSASAFANRGGGGVAIAGAAGISLTGTGGITASDGIVLEANATAAEFLNTGAGSVSFRIESGSTAVVNAGSLVISAAGGSSPNFVFGTGPGNGFGQFAIDILGGSLNLQNLFAFVNGTGPFNRQTSRLVANGGNINVSNNLRLRSALDIEVSTGSGSIIGNAVLTGNTAIFEVEAGGQIQIVGDGSAGTGLFGQTFTIDAGNSILFGGNLTSRNGVVTLTSRPFGLPQTRGITMASGARIDAGTGTVTVRAADGTITLANIAAGRIDVRNLGLLAGSDITVRLGSVLTASGTGRAIDLASLGGEVINLAGDAGLVLTGGGHYGIFAATPTGSQIGSFANYARRYNVANAAAYDALNPGGNFAAFRIVPFLTVSAAAVSRVYGNANPTFTASFAGFLPGDGIGGLTGTPQFTTLATSTSNIGQFAINAALGSLLSAQGYQFTFAPGVLNVTPRPLTLTANNLSRLYGNANPALTFAIGGLGLVNGDLLSGALATTAGTTTGVGNVAITQGTLVASANYALTFVNGQLTITPRLLTVSADNLSKLLGTRDPALTFVLSGDGLVNGDQLSGALVRDAGERIGEFAIRQGTLGAGSNYAITYANGQLTINAPPAPPGINNPTNFVPPIRIGDQPPPIVDEDEVRFGIDFPKSFEASLISEDPLLDDPVTSGGDASVYGDTAVPGGGGK